ncbi:MAG: hypothetical protein WD065_13400 [Planctomycetaceae bacterium]
MAKLLWYGIDIHVATLYRVEILEDSMSNSQQSNKSQAEYLQQLDSYIAFLKDKLDRVQHLRWSLTDPQTFAIFTAMNSTPRTDEEVKDAIEKIDQQLPPSGPQLPAQRLSSRLTRFDAIDSFFKRHNNNWATTHDVSNDTTLPERAIREVIYKTHKERFERKNNLGGRGKVFRLVDHQMKGGEP